MKWLRESAPHKELSDDGLTIYTDFKGSNLDLARELVNFWSWQESGAIHERFLSKVPCEADFDRMLRRMTYIVACYGRGLGNEKLLMGYLEASEIKDGSKLLEIAVSVDGEYRRRGLALKMVRRAVVIAEQMGFVGAKVNVLPGNVATLNLMAKLGTEFDIEKIAESEYDCEYIIRKKK